MSNITSHRMCDRDYNKQMAYYRQLEIKSKKKRSKSRQKKGLWRRVLSGSLGAVSPKVFQRMMKLITVTGLLSKQKLIEVIRKLKNLSDTTAQRVNLRFSLRSQSSYVSQIVENDRLTGTRLFMEKAVALKVSCEKNLAKWLVLPLGPSKGEKVYPPCSKIVKLSCKGKKAKGIHISLQENPDYHHDSFDETLEDRVRPIALTSTTNATVIDSTKKPSLIEAYHRYTNSQGADRQQAYTCFKTLLLNCKVDINDRDSDGKTLLHYVAANNDLKTAAKVVNYPGIDPNIKDNNGDTALDVAIERDNEVLTKLIKTQVCFFERIKVKLTSVDTMESTEVSNTVKCRSKDNLVNTMSALPEIDSDSGYLKIYNDEDSNRGRVSLCCN